MIKDKHKKILLILPAYNEQAIIKRTVEKVIKNNYDYIVINDGSIDKTEEILRNNCYNHITLQKNMGIGRAVQEGYKYAERNDYDIAVQFDADGQHDINSVAKLVQPILNNEADFTIGSRFIQRKDNNFRSSFARRMGIKLISKYIKLLSKRKIFDTTSGFRAANKSVIKRFANNYPQRYPEPSSTFMLLKHGYRVTEIPVRMYERNGGKSSISAVKSVGYMFSVFADIAKTHFILNKKGSAKVHPAK